MKRDQNLVTFSRKNYFIFSRLIAIFPILVPRATAKAKVHSQDPAALARIRGRLGPYILLRIEKKVVDKKPQIGHNFHLSESKRPNLNILNLLRESFSVFRSLILHLNAI